MRFKEIYLDNGATTKVDPKVLEAMNYYHTDKYGNPSSIHSFGQDSKDALEGARKVIAKSIGARNDEIIFTSGGTESDNLAIKGVINTQQNNGCNCDCSNSRKNHIITTKIEHPAIKNTCKALEKEGYEVTYLDVDKEGFVDLEKLRNSITEKTILVTIIHANNEIGTIQDLEGIGNICKEKKVLFHTDAVQSFTKTKLNVVEQNLDLVSLSAHKIHGPKGIGALFVKRGTKLKPLMFGGSQEFELKPGTENVPGIVGFSEAVKIANEKHIEYMKKLRDKLIEGALKIPGTRLNGPKERLCNNINLSFRGIEGEALGGYLDQKWVCSSTGSACSSRTLEPSHVLKAIGLSDEEAHGSLRLTLSKFNTEKEIDYVLKILPKYVEKLRKISPFGKIKNILGKNKEDLDKNEENKEELSEKKRTNNEIY